MYTCSECNNDFEHASPFGDDIQCPACKTWLETDSEYDMDNCYFWVVGKSENQYQEVE
jgi:hypothetical protein